MCPSGIALPARLGCCRGAVATGASAGGFVAFWKVGVRYVSAIGHLNDDVSNPASLRPLSANSGPRCSNAVQKSDRCAASGCGSGLPFGLIGRGSLRRAADVEIASSLIHRVEVVLEVAGHAVGLPRRAVGVCLRSEGLTHARRDDRVAVVGGGEELSAKSSGDEPSVLRFLVDALRAAARAIHRCPKLVLQPCHARCFRSLTSPGSRPAITGTRRSICRRLTR